MNDDFGLPPGAAVKVTETTAQRMARLRAQAEAQAADEFDEAGVFAKLLETARAEREKKLLLPENDTVLPTDTQGFPEDYDVIVIAPGQSENDLNYVPAGLNGLGFKFPRDEEIIVPHIVVTECLDHAIEHKTTQSKGGLILRKVQRFPYQFRRKATPAEYKAFQIAQREKANRETGIAA